MMIIRIIVIIFILMIITIVIVMIVVILVVVIIISISAIRIQGHPRSTVLQATGIKWYHTRRITRSACAWRGIKLCRLCL